MLLLLCSGWPCQLVTSIRRRRIGDASSTIRAGAFGRRIVLSAHAGVHSALHAGAERDHRALLPQPEVGICLAAQLHQLRPRAA